MFRIICAILQSSQTTSPAISDQHPRGHRELFWQSGQKFPAASISEQGRTKLHTKVGGVIRRSHNLTPMSRLTIRTQNHSIEANHAIITIFGTRRNGRVAGAIKMSQNSAFRRHLGGGNRTIHLTKCGTDRSGPLINGAGYLHSQRSLRCSRWHLIAGKRAVGDIKAEPFQARNSKDDGVIISSLK
jgi:hypothetical protein